ncbi:hypothetical protein EDB81DRAFT_860564 [Dactylonectria macrodidyma]|uniref:Uncharacterized protein n=1 Tax=Dactylonectria macrodidyma TaxID=307937 RepID=A0A9P9DVM3_9HYPO|nr:hypothetical protein EDB81DRAFT_860564 [Dactylonectria macrodidyma]
MISHARALRREDFQIAVICALPLEYDAVVLAFDEIPEDDGRQLGNAPGDYNKYKTGRIGSHNVVLLLLPGMGKTNAASAAASLRSSYTGIQLAILAGICGGVPGVETENELLLGDVVISKSIVQYDLGRRYPDRFSTKDTVEDSLGRPSKNIRSLVAMFGTSRGCDDLQRRASQVLEQIQQKATVAGHHGLYKCPMAAEDCLFEPAYIHRHRGCQNCRCSESGACETALGASCEELQCDVGRHVSRRRLKKRKMQNQEADPSQECDTIIAQELQVLVGRVGSGDTVMKSGLDRDRIAREHNLIAFEMEGAGVWDEIPCIVVKAVCDYADSHKNKKWQYFAAARAASTTKALLESYPHTDKSMAPSTQSPVPNIENPDLAGRAEHNEKETKLLQMLAAEHDAYKNFNPRRVAGTCEWFFRDQRFHKWLDSTASSIIWVSAGPGCGKSVLARALIDEGRLSTSTATTTVCYFFFKDGEDRRINSSDALSALLHQLFTQNRTSSLIRHAASSFKNYGDKLRDNFHQLWQILTDCARNPDAGEIVCVLDALDECSKNGRQGILEVLKTFYFSDQVHLSSSRLKFLITSRPYDDLEMSFENLATAESYIRFDGDDKSEEIRHEIDLVIDHRVNEFGKDFLDKHRWEISKRLKAMENRTYLWLHLTLSIINEKRSAFSKPSSIHTLLSHLPSGVFDAYEKILSRSQDEKQARCLLRIILAATRPLTLDELNHSLTLQEKGFSNYDELKNELWPYKLFKSAVRNLCGLFINVYDNKVSFIHQTAREFLTTNSRSQNTWQGSFNMPLAHSSVFISCARLLILQDLDMIAHHRPGNEALLFISYAAVNWALHYNSQDGDQRVTSCEIARALCRISGGQTPTWVEVYRKARHFPFSYVFCWTDLTLASYFGLLEVVVHMVNQEKVDINSRGGYFGTAITAAAAQGHSELVQTLLQHDADCDTGAGYFRTPLLAAASKGHTRAVGCLLSSGAQVTQEVIMAAAHCWQGGDEVMALLLEKCGDKVEITEEVVVAVARKSKQMMDVLLEKYGDRVKITQRVFITATENTLEVMVLLLEKYGDDVKITQEAIIAAAGNIFYGQEMMALLLEKRGDEVEVTESVLREAAGNDGIGDKIVALLLEKCGDELTITPDVVKAAASNKRCGKEITALLLGKRGDEVEITQEVIMAAAKKGSSGTMAFLLEKYGDKVEITPEVVKAAAGNGISGKGIMALLLEKCGDEVEITQEVMIAAVKGGSNEMVGFLLGKYGDEIEITPEVIEAAAGINWQGKVMMDLLLEKCGDEVKITPKAVVAAAGAFHGEETMTLLLEKRGSEVKVTEEVVLAAVGNPWGTDMVELLLEMRGDEIKITPKVIEAAAKNIGGKEIIALLLEARRDGIKIMQEDVIAAARNSRGEESVDSLLQAYEDKFKIAQEAVIAVAKHMREGNNGLPPGRTWR